MKNIIRACLFLCFFPLGSLASGGVSIGEIKSEGATASDEFIVLENSSEAAIGLGNWSIQYKSANGVSFYKKNFPKDASVPANGRYVVCANGYGGSCDMRHSSFALSSAGGTVYLVSNQTLLTDAADTALILDLKTYGPDEEEVPAGETEDRLPAAAGEKTGIVPAVVINEFMPVSGDEKEWIELYDPTGYAHDLEGWTLSDGTGRPFIALSGLIAPSGFKVAEVSPDLLNDEGDLIILRDKEGKEIDSVAYGDWPRGDANAPGCGRGEAIARIGEGVDSGRDNRDFAATSKPTPGLANILSAPQGKAKEAPKKEAFGDKSAPMSEESALEQLLALLSDKEKIIIIEHLAIAADGKKKTEADRAKPTAQIAKAQNPAPAAPASKTTVKSGSAVEGQIIAPVGITGKDMAIMREGERTIELRLPKDLKAVPEPGDMVKASGTWSTAKTIALPRLLVKTASAFAVTGRNPVPAPAEIAMDQIADHAGEIATISGTVVEKQSTRLRLALGESSVLVKQAFAAEKGEIVSATGLIVKSGEDFILTPLSPSSLAIIKPPEKKSASFARKAAPYAFCALPASMLVAAVYFGKKYGKRKGGDSP